MFGETRDPRPACGVGAMLPVKWLKSHESAAQARDGFGRKSV
jgi:hypothetical protein